MPYSEATIWKLLRNSIFQTLPLKPPQSNGNAANKKQNPTVATTQMLHQRHELCPLPKKKKMGEKKKSNTNKKPRAINEKSSTRKGVMKTNKTEAVKCLVCKMC